MKKLFLFILLCTTLSIFSQKEANIWYFGENAGVDFSSGTPVALTDGKLDTQEGCSSISDKNGNLLFYSDGINVYTKNHELMKYSDGRLANNLEGNPSSSQSGLIVPNPDKSNIYYIFTVGTDYVGGNSGLPKNPGFNFYTVDISKGNGGEIIEGPINLSKGKDEDWSEKITAVQGSTCKEIWVLSIVEDTFYAYKVDKDGVKYTTPITSSTSYFLQDKRGYLKASPDGTKLALADFTDQSRRTNIYMGNGTLVLFDFNTTTGIVSNPQKLTTPNLDGIPYGIEFSAQSSKLYSSNYDPRIQKNKIFQFDLFSSDIERSKTQIGTQDSYRGALQLAPNGKIYSAASYQTHLSAIENPEDDAKDVVFTERAINLGKTTTQGLPPFIQSFFAPVNLINKETSAILNNTNQVFCIGNSYTIEPEKNNVGDTYIWSKDGTEISTNRELTITNDAPFGSGIYEVKIISASACKKTFTGKVQITFKPKPTINNISTYVQCDFDANPFDGITTFNLTSKEAELVDDLTNISIDFFETSDTGFTTPLNKSNYTNTVATNHSVIAKATNTVTNCYDTKIVNLEVKATSPNTYDNEYICELDTNASNPTATFSLGSNNSFFDFSTKTAKIIANSGGALSLNAYNFQYYRTALDASLQTNEIVPPYEDDLFTNNSEVFVRISNKTTSACETVGSFKIFVEKLPIPQGNSSEQILCIDNPRANPQTKYITLNADTGVSTDTYQWYLNGNLIPNATTATHQATSEGTYKVESYRAHSKIANSCAGYNTFFVKESNKALIVSTKVKDDQNNPATNTIEVTVKGIGDYEYALNSANLSDFQKGTENLSFTFSDIKPGLNKIYIRDRNECGVVVTNDISIIYFQRHFSPNQDGHLDTWNVLGVDNNFYDVIKIQIFNRHGKLLKQITNKNDVGWNGTFNGKTLPSNDYWYNAELIDKNGNIRKKTGHFSLIRK